ncbi:MAG TPA: hypothetical protein VN228_22065 [Pyrinomonadaceae bacterium]|nr:hypothetical protein [Pyrinomonadaceae bacterium]
MFPPFTDIETLAPAQCEEICSAVHHLRDYWSQVNDGVLFFTLGAASYIEFCRPGEAAERYYGKARALNPLLDGYFPGIMEHLRGTLEAHLGEPVAFAEEFGRPGFHIWLTEAIPTEPSASVHFDLQYQRLGWPAHAEIDYGRPVSFTLPLRLPAGGGGVNVWDIHYGEAEEAMRLNLPFSVEELQAVRERAHYAYAPGRLVLHSGHFLHQIAPAAFVRPGDERITMQGHALRCGGRWLVYW